MLPAVRAGPVPAAIRNQPVSEHLDPMPRTLPATERPAPVCGLAAPRGLGRSPRSTWSSAGAVVLAALIALGGCADAATSAREARGRELYSYCEQCHGTDGLGKPEFRVPSLRHLPAWYIEAQVTKFRVGARGDHPDDVDGLRMRPMSRALASAAEVQIVSEYIEQFLDAPEVIEGEAPPPRTIPHMESTLSGNAERGRALFATCIQCHGERAEGRRDMNAPRLAGANDWYLVAQIKKFQAGIRGADALDTTGAQMRPMAATLVDDQSIFDVVAYVATLQEPQPH